MDISEITAIESGYVDDGKPTLGLAFRELKRL